MNPNEASANKSYNITGNGTTVISLPANPAGKLVLIGITIGVKGGSGHTAVIYDSTEALGANPAYRVGTIDTVNNGGLQEFPLPFFRGIYIVTGGGTTSNLTVIYKEIA